MSDISPHHPSPPNPGQENSTMATLPPRPKATQPRPESEFTYIEDLSSKHCQVRQHQKDEDYEIICNGEKFFRTYDNRDEVLSVRDVLDRGFILYESCKVRRWYMQSIGRLNDYLQRRQTCELSVSEESLWNGHHLGIDDIIAWDNSIISSKDIWHISKIVLGRYSIVSKEQVNTELAIFKKFFEMVLRSYHDNAPSMVASK